MKSLAIRITPTATESQYFVNELEKIDGKWRNKKCEGMKAKSIRIDESTTVFELFDLVTEEKEA